MGRWTPGARQRLQAAALDLFLEDGFDETTVSEIARRSGLTERTFFRHFADKREVLFDGSAELQERFVGTVRDAPEATGVMEIIALALDAAAAAFPADRQEYSRRRQATIDRTPSLQERELLKLATLTAALAGAFRQRGIAEPHASIAAETTVSVFRVGFERWRHAPDGSGLAEVQREVLDSVRSLVGGG